LRRRERHLGRIKEGPGLKPLFIWASIQGLKAPAPSEFTLCAKERPPANGGLFCFGLELS
jgi:hypothetical protein